MTRKVLTAAACVIGLVAFQQAPAMAQNNPPMTGDAKDITQTSAVLSGTFYGGANFASMGWGPAPKKGVANCGPLKTTGAQSCVAQPLSCGTTYYFTATNGKQTGDWKPFTTQPCKGGAPVTGPATGPVTGDARDITQTSAVLSGTFYGKTNFASMGWGPAPRKGVANCGPLKTTGAQSCVAQPLSCGTTYYFTATNGKQTGEWKPLTTAPCK